MNTVRDDAHKVELALAATQDYEALQALDRLVEAFDGMSAFADEWRKRYYKLKEQLEDDGA